MEEELIEFVRREKCLYDVKHSDYVKAKLKDSIWKRIAKELNLRDGNEAKKTWEKLRNNHRDALRRQKKCPSGTVNIKQWRYQENMAFLLPHMGNRFSNTLVREEVQSDEPSHSETRDSDVQDNLIDDEEPRTDNEDTAHSPEPLSTFGQACKRRRYERDNFSTELHKYRRRTESRDQITPNREQETKRLVTDTVKDLTVNNVNNGPLFHFFMSMFETTKKLPPMSQHIIKTNVFSLVSREELKNLQSSSRTSSNTQIAEAGPYYASFTPSPLQVQQHESIPAEAGTGQINTPEELILKQESDSMFEYNAENFN